MIGHDDLERRSEFLHGEENQFVHPGNLLLVVILQGVHVAAGFGITFWWKINLSRLIEEQKARYWPLVLTEMPVKSEMSYEVVTYPILSTADPVARLRSGWFVHYNRRGRNV